MLRVFHQQNNHSLILFANWEPGIPTAIKYLCYIPFQRLQVPASGTPGVVAHGLFVGLLWPVCMCELGSGISLQAPVQAPANRHETKLFSETDPALSRVRLKTVWELLYGISQVKPLATGPRHLGKQRIITHPPWEQTSSRSTIPRVYTMAVLEVPTRFKRRVRTARMDEDSGGHRSCPGAQTASDPSERGCCGDTGHDFLVSKKLHPSH